MRPLIRIFLVVSFVAALVAVRAPQDTQAQTKKLSPGQYAGRFHYTLYATFVDNQAVGGITSHIESIGNIDIEGTIVLQVDKNGNFKSGMTIIPSLITTYRIHTFSLTPAACSALSYLGGETGATIKQSTSASSRNQALFFAADLNLNDISPVYFKTTGNVSDCTEFPTQATLTMITNDMIKSVNSFKAMKFLVVRNTKTSISGVVEMPGFAKKFPSPGGMYVDRDEGSFVLYKYEPLSPLEEDPPSVVPLVPSAEWRSK